MTNKEIKEAELDKLVSNDENLNKRALVSKLLDASEVKTDDLKKK